MNDDNSPIKPNPDLPQPGQSTEPTPQAPATSPQPVQLAEPAQPIEPAQLAESAQPTESQPAPIEQPIQPTSTPTSQAVPISQSSQTAVPIPTAAPTPTPTPTPTNTPNPTPTPEPTLPESDPLPDLPQMSPKKQPKGKRTTIVLVAVIAILVLCVTIVLVMTLNTNNSKKSNGSNSSQPANNSQLYDETYDLSALTSDLNINKAGVYELKGKMPEGHSIIVNADDEVTLHLSGVTVAATQMAAIANISPNPLIIEIEDGTSNTLSDGGASDYASCIFSTGALIIDGDSGKLTITGQQANGEGIATKSNNLTINGGNINIRAADDGLNAGGEGGIITINNGTLNILAGGGGIDSNDKLIFNGGTVYVSGSGVGGNVGIDAEKGYVINGGTLMILGPDMLELPNSTSKQNVLIIALDKTYIAGSEIALLNSEEETIVKYTARDGFRTLIISSPELFTGEYKLNINNEPVISSIIVEKNITTIGNLKNPEESDSSTTNDNDDDSKNSEDKSDSQTDDVPTGDVSKNEENGDTYGRIPVDQLPSE